MLKLKAVLEVAQLSDVDFYIAIAKGIELIIEHANRIDDERAILEKQDAWRSSRILFQLESEEIAKVFILLDAVRCTKRRPQFFSKQLARFNNHLWKVIYSEYFEWHLADLREGIRYIESDREKYYLDGPNDCDWIFYNRPLAEREMNLYVDYILSEAGCYWHSPATHEDGFMFRRKSPTAIELALCMQDAGMLSTDSLHAMANFWEKVEVDESTTWVQLVRVNRDFNAFLGSRNLLRDNTDSSQSFVINHLLFPLYAIATEQKDVSKEDLEVERKRILQRMSQEMFGD